ncbi:MAG: phospholipase D-like domain-containing protein [Gemmataceae bacterium]
MNTPQTQAFFSPGADCLGQIIHRITYARRTIDICVFTITDDRITRILLEAHRRGVQIRIISDNEKSQDAGSDVVRLEQAGIPTRIDRSIDHMHHKFAIFDGLRLINGSYNWTRGAAEQNLENIVDSGEPALIDTFQDYFEQLWQKLA